MGFHLFFARNIWQCSERARGSAFWDQSWLVEGTRWVAGDLTQFATCKAHVLLLHYCSGPISLFQKCSDLNNIMGNVWSQDDNTMGKTLSLHAVDLGLIPQHLTEFPRAQPGVSPELHQVWPKKKKEETLSIQVV